MTPFVALAVTPWHAVGVESHVAFHGASCDVANSVVLMGAYDPETHLLSPDAFPRCRHGGAQFVRLPNRFRVWDHFKTALATVAFTRGSEADAQPLDVVMPRAPADVLTEIFWARSPKTFRHCRFLILDEGIGSYTYEMAQRKSWFAQRPPLHHIRRRMLHEFWRIGRRWVDTRPLEFHTAFEIDPVSRSMSLRGARGAAYAKVLRSAAVALPVGDSGNRPKALFLTEPHAAEAWYPSSVDVRISLHAARLLLDRGYDVYVKPHPSEDTNTVHGYFEPLNSNRVTLLDGANSAEAYAAKLGEADVVVGIISSALLSCRLLFENLTFSLADLILEDPDLPQQSRFRASAAQFKSLAEPIGVLPIAEIPAARRATG